MKHAKQRIAMTALTLAALALSGCQKPPEPAAPTPEPAAPAPPGEPAPTGTDAKTDASFDPFVPPETQAPPVPELDPVPDPESEQEPEAAPEDEPVSIPEPPPVRSASRSATPGAEPAAPRQAQGTVEYAQVVSVTPVRQSIDNPREVCRDVEVAYEVAPRDQHRIAGTVVGALVGGAVGNQVGDGSGRDVARIAGAVAGGVAGRKIQEHNQIRNAQTRTRLERQCETVNNPSMKTVAYDVVYVYGGQSYSARVAEDPGERIRLPVRGIEL